MLRWWWRFVALLPAFKHWKDVGFLSILRSNHVEVLIKKRLTFKTVLILKFIQLNSLKLNGFRRVAGFERRPV
jgi:hypothetical protein